MLSSAALILPFLTAMPTDELPHNAPFAPSPELQSLAEHAATEAIVKFGSEGLSRDLFSLTVVEIDRSRGPQPKGDYRGNVRFYPASVVKVFFLAYGHQVMQEGKLESTPEFARAMRDMIVTSSNDATHAVLDYTTFTTGGPEMPEREFAVWREKRQSVNRWFAERGYPHVNACQKTWCEGPYGRERAFLGPNFENRNMLTSDDTARLMMEIALDRIVTPERCVQMRETLRRKNPADHEDADFQARAFIGRALPSGAELYSKAGYTSTSRHDTAYVKLANGREFVLAIYTHNNANKPEIIPFIAEHIVQYFNR